MWIIVIAIDIVTSLLFHWLLYKSCMDISETGSYVQVKEDIALSQDQHRGALKHLGGETHWFQISAEGQICPTPSVHWAG